MLFELFANPHSRRCASRFGLANRKLNGFRPPIRVVAVVVCWISAVCPGCQFPGLHRESGADASADSGSTDKPTEPRSDDSATIFNRSLERIAVDFRVHLITAPHGTFGADSRLWSIARGSLSDPESVLLLATNGFRAAVGRTSDRDVLTSYLDSINGVRMAMDEVTPDVDRPVSIELGAGPSWASVFVLNRDGHVRGMDIVNSALRFVLRFEFRSASLREVFVRVVPEVEEPPGPARWQKLENGEYREMPELRRQTFTELEVAAEIPEGGFLILGPDAASESASRLGRLFFVDDRTERGRDSSAPTTAPSEEATSLDRIYIISPIVRTIESPAKR